MHFPTRYSSVQVDGRSIFFRDAGPRNAPTLLLLHGLPSSSRMFEPLIRELSDRYRLIAPDYPGFGHSDWPPPSEFSYTFDRIAQIMGAFTDALRLDRFTLYMQDYGGPIGFRMAMNRPQQIQSMIIQNAVAHEEGLSELWEVRRAFWRDRASHEDELRRNLLSAEATRRRHVGSDPAVELYDPDLWTDELAFLHQAGQADIQAELFYDYRTNLSSYHLWQTWLQTHQPRLLVLWGKYDPSFTLKEPEAYRRDVPHAQVHILEAGHFALDTAAKQIARHVATFMDS